jgi:hypothetical protein
MGNNKKNKAAKREAIRRRNAKVLGKNKLVDGVNELDGKSVINMTRGFFGAVRQGVALAAAIANSAGTDKWERKEDASNAERTLIMGIELFFNRLHELKYRSLSELVMLANDYNLVKAHGRFVWDTSGSISIEFIPNDEQ